MADSAPKDFSEMLPNLDRTAGRGAQYWMDVGIIVGAAAIVALGFVIWATVFRNRGRKRKAIHIMGAGGRASGGKGTDTEHRKRQGRGERFVRRNPTLAETGGLPPVRPEGSEPSSSPQSHLPS